MADADSKAPKDRHPELSAPIIDLGLEARIARAEQAVMDRDARVRGDVLSITDTLRSKRGGALRWAAIAGAGAAAIAVGYAGYKAWRRHRREPLAKRAGGSSIATSFASAIAGIARIAAQWAWKLHREQVDSGSLVGMLRNALWPSSAARSAAGAPTAPSNGVNGADARP